MSPAKYQNPQEQHLPRCHADRQKGVKALAPYQKWCLTPFLPAVKALAPQCDVVIVVGSPTSSNSNRLREVAENLDVAAYMVDNASEIDPRWVSGKERVGVTAGASAPEILVRAVIDRLDQLGIGSVADLDGVEEKVGFPLPKGLG